MKKISIALCFFAFLAGIHDTSVGGRKKLDRGVSIAVKNLTDGSGFCPGRKFSY